MKQRLLQLSILAILVIALAATASAYDAPGSAAPGGNSGGPITIGTQDQVKRGFLSVGTFNAKKGAQLGNPQCSDGIDNNLNGVADAQDKGCHTDGNASIANTYDPNIFSETPGSSTTSSTTFEQIIRGDNDTFATGDKPLAFGDGSNKVSIAAGGNIAATNVLQSNTLKDNVTKKLCGDEDGIVLLCPPVVSAPVNLNIGLTFTQPQNANYSITVEVKNIKTNTVSTLTNTGNTGQTSYYQSIAGLPPGVYETQFINASCNYLANGYNMGTAEGSQYILDKNHNTMGYTLQCEDTTFQAGVFCNDGLDNDGDGKVDYRDGVVVNGQPKLQDPECGSSPDGNE